MLDKFDLLSVNQTAAQIKLQEAWKASRDTKFNAKRNLNLTNWAIFGFFIFIFYFILFHTTLKLLKLLKLITFYYQRNKKMGLKSSSYRNLETGLFRSCFNFNSRDNIYLHMKSKY